MDYEFKYRKVAEALYEALQGDAFYQTMEKSVSNGSSKEAMIRYMDYAMVEAERYGELFIPRTHDYGASVWARPMDEDLEEEKHRRKMIFLADHMGKGCVSTYKTIVAFMSAKSHPLIAEDAWYLSILGILPEFQGRGLGAGLVDGIIAETDGSGVPTYLETFTPRNISFYERLGYRAIEAFQEPTTGAEYTLMVREAKTDG